MITFSFFSNVASISFTRSSIVVVFCFDLEGLRACGKLSTVEEWDIKGTGSDTFGSAEAWEAEMEVEVFAVIVEVPVLELLCICH